MSVPLGGMMIRSQPQGITWGALQVWCDRNGTDDDEREFIDAVVRRLDAEYLKWWTDKNKT